MALRMQIPLPSNLKTIKDFRLYSEHYRITDDGRIKKVTITEIADKTLTCTDTKKEFSGSDVNLLLPSYLLTPGELLWLHNLVRRSIRANYQAEFYTTILEKTKSRESDYVIFMYWFITIQRRFQKKVEPEKFQGLLDTIIENIKLIEI